MITRPLDLASKLRPEPRNFDFLFLVNGGLIVLFFTLFGSPFVLAPGLGMNFKMPEMRGAGQGAVATTDVISIKQGGVIVTESGNITLPQLRDWLKVRAKASKHPLLLVRAHAQMPLEDIAEIQAAAKEAGYAGIVLGAEEPSAVRGGR